jgi:hypothetical protein
MKMEDKGRNKVFREIDRVGGDREGVGGREGGRESKKATRQ